MQYTIDQAGTGLVAEADLSKDSNNVARPNRPGFLASGYANHIVRRILLGHIRPPSLNSPASHK